MLVVGGGASALDLLDQSLLHGAAHIVWAYRSLRWFTPTTKPKAVAGSVRPVARLQAQGVPLERQNELVRADLETNKIDFTLVRDETTSGNRKSGARGAAKSFAKPLADEPGAKFAKKPLARRGEKPVERSQAKSEGKTSAKLTAKPAAKPPVKAAVKKAPVKAKVKEKPAVKRTPKAAAKPVVKKAAKKR